MTFCVFKHFTEALSADRYRIYAGRKAFGGMRKMSLQFSGDDNHVESAAGRPLLLS
jgi:hypothetical protein